MNTPPPPPPPPRPQGKIYYYTSTKIYSKLKVLADDNFKFDENC